MILTAAQAAAQIAVRIAIRIARAIRAAPVHRTARQLVRLTVLETITLQLAEAIAAQIRLAKTEKAAAHKVFQMSFLAI